MDEHFAFIRVYMRERWNKSGVLLVIYYFYKIVSSNGKIETCMLHKKKTKENVQKQKIIKNHTDMNVSF